MSKGRDHERVQINRCICRLLHNRARARTHTHTHLPVFSTPRSGFLIISSLRKPTEPLATCKNAAIITRALMKIFYRSIRLSQFPEILPRSKTSLILPRWRLIWVTVNHDTIRMVFSICKAWISRIRVTWVNPCRYYVTCGLSNSICNNRHTMTFCRGK